MKKVFVFDLDGTLIDSLEMINYCFNQTSQKYGLKPVEKEKFNYFLGDGPKILVRKSLDYLIERDGLDKNEVYSKFDEIYEAYIDFYNNFNDTKTKLYPNIRESLEELKRKNALLCICTNKTLPAAEKILNRLFPKGFFDYVSALQDETKRKPNPYLLDKIVDELKIKKKEIVYFGDTNTDIETCKNAKVTSVGVDWGFRPRQELIDAKADFVISEQRKIVDFYGELPKNTGQNN